MRSRHLLSAGRAVSLLVAALLWGLTCPAAPAGVKRLTLQSTVLKISNVLYQIISEKHQKTILKIRRKSGLQTGFQWI
ncbi:hypothetical protein SAMN05192533_102128 [Mesobacillus persicus]|uniref:Uncharacterized protein n=1 Tax=Mesobacillus persicus TaxID=930146 RepID=A0A1H7XCW4_9BACI|nr:hypothetical protein SAMN05192533_102128 [Mesobacillus persicus]